MDIAEFPVAGISEIQWSSAPFDCLTIPKEQKEVIVALAEARTNSENGFEFDDVIAGKGRGLIALLQYDSQNSFLYIRLRALAASQEWERQSRLKLLLSIFGGLSIR